ncbi:MAG: SDR family oxidoreductase [Steroidobacteraceae bacterium]
MARFSGKNAIVVGASAEGGSGWATAERLAREGARVVVAARNLESLQRLADRIDGHAVRCDASKPDDIAALAQQSAKLLGRIDVAIYAAGWPKAGTIASTTPDDLMEALGVNFMGPFCFVRSIAEVMNDGGAISVISSLASTNVVPGQVAYACAKAATNLMVRYAAVELAPRRIRANVVVPSLIASPMSEPFRAMPGVVDTIMKEVPLKRAATAQDVAAACLWLASDECFATGSLLPVDGGHNLRRAPYPEDFPKGAYESMEPDA